MMKVLSIIFHFLILSHLSFTHNVIASKKDDEKATVDDIRILHKAAPQLNTKILKLAANAYNHAYDLHKVKKPVLTVIDYSKPSSQKRMWVFDIAQDKLLYKTHVAHGRNSGALYAKSFSNRNNSKASSLGTYVTTTPYIGGKGYSLNLKGLETGYNDHAFSRRVVIHGAWYMNESFIKNSGRAGRSWGCPAVSNTLAKPIINTIKNGSVVFAYYPDESYLSHSKYLT